MAVTRKSGRVTAGLFGWMHASGVGELVDIGPGRLTGQKYVELLEEVLLPTVQALLFPEGEPFYLLQDNSPIHMSRAAQEWFTRHPYITVLPHPPRSPDLNPIEHIWAAMAKHRDVQERLRGRDDVVQSALQAWEHLRRPPGQRLTSALVASMPSRLNAVLDAGGAYTKY